MFTATGRAPRPIPGTRLRRITATLAAVASGALAWPAAIPAASAAIIPVPAGGGGYGPAGGASAAIPVPVIVTGGMPGWQITLIAAAAALGAAAAAVLLDRARARRRTAAPADNLQTRPDHEGDHGPAGHAGQTQAKPDVLTLPLPETRTLASQNTNGRAAGYRRLGARNPRTHRPLHSNADR